MNSFSSQVTNQFRIDASMQHPIQPEDTSYRDPTFKSYDASQQNIFFSRSDQQNPSALADDDEVSLTNGPDQEPFEVPHISLQLDDTQVTKEPQLNKYKHLFDQDLLEPKSNLAIQLLNPTKAFIQTAILLIYCVSLIYFFYLPLRLTILDQNFDWFFLITKLIDCFLQIICSTAHRGEFIQDFKTVIIIYITEQRMILDTLSLFSIALLQPLMQWPQIQWVISIAGVIIGLKRFFEQKRLILYTFNLYNSTTITCFSLIYIIAAINLLICLWMSVCDFDLITHSLYLDGLFHVISILTMNSSFKPQNDHELLLFCLIAIMSPLLLGFAVTLFYNLSHDSLKCQFDLNDFFEKYKVSTMMKHLIISDLHQSKAHKQIKLPKFSSNLLKRLHHIRRFSVLTNYFKGYDRQTVAQLVDQCEELVFDSNQKVIEKGQKDENAIYFILDGNLQLNTSTGAQLGQLIANEHFGEFSFYTQQCRTVQIVASSSCILLKLSQQRFLSHLTLVEREIYFQVREDILLNKKNPFACFNCKEATHGITCCPHLTYNPDRLRIIVKHLQDLKHKRNKVIRRKHKKSPKAVLLNSFWNENQERLADLFGDLLIMNSQLSSPLSLPYDEPASQSHHEKSVKLSNIYKLKSLYEQNDDDEEISELIRSEAFLRNEQSKGTLNTAGFPVLLQKRSKEGTLNIIMEQDSQDVYEEEDVERVEIFPEEKKQTFQLADEQTSERVTLKPDRSPVHPKGTFKKGNSRTNSQKNSLENSWAQSPIISYTQRHNQDRMRSRTSSQSHTVKSLTKRPSNRYTNLQSTFYVHQENAEAFYAKHILNEFERMHLMINLNPHNNYDKVIEEYNTMEWRKKFQLDLVRKIS